MRLAPHRLRVISTDSQLPVGRQRARNAEVRFGQYLRGFQHPPKFTYKPYRKLAAGYDLTPLRRARCMSSLGAKLRRACQSASR